MCLQHVNVLNGRKTKNGFQIALKTIFVELEGFEPSSAQGNHTLSTRLFQPLVFVTWQDLDHQPCPYPLRIHTCNEACKSYFRFTCTA